MRLAYLQRTVYIYSLGSNYGTVGASAKRTRSPGADVVARPGRGCGDHRRGTKLRKPGRKAVFIYGMSRTSRDAAEICRRPKCHRSSRRTTSGKHLPDSATAALGRSCPLVTAVSRLQFPAPATA